MEVKAAQIRLMGDPETVRLLAEQLVKAGFMAITGSTENRRDGGLRVYGAGVVKTINTTAMDADQNAISA